MFERPGDYSLHLYRGDSYTYNFVLWDDEAHTIASDLSGVVARAQIRDTTWGGLVMEPICSIAGNIIEMQINSDMWLDAKRDTAVWDLQLTYPDASIITILAGGVVFAGDVTHA